MNKLLHVSANIYPPLDGKYHHTKKIWSELSKDFDEYHVIARSETNRYSFSREGKIFLHLVPRITKKSKSFFFTSIWMLYLIKKYGITHLTSQCSIVGGFTAVLSSQLYKIPLMTEIHGDVYFKYMKEISLQDKIYSKICKYTFKHSTRIRSLSHSMTDMLRDFDILGNVVEVPNRVDLTLFNSNRVNYKLHNPIRIISIGRFVEQKGYDIAIEAIKQLSGEFNIELSLIGGGELYEKLESESVEFDNIKLIKWIEQKDLRKLLDESDIYIQPSKPFYGEAMPRTILEAMAMKLPVISTKIAAIPGILNMSNSRMINPSKVSELTSAIKTLIEDNALRKRIALQGFKDVSTKYEWNSIFELYRSEIKRMKY